MWMQIIEENFKDVEGPQDPMRISADGTNKVFTCTLKLLKIIGD